MNTFWEVFGARPELNVELIGGPFDGYFKRVHELDTRLSLLVSRSFVESSQFDDGLPEEGSDPQPETTTSIAVYILGVKDGRWVYLFFRSQKLPERISNDLTAE